jgi:galactokinase
MATATFQDLFGFAPEARAKAPGRVNLLGEHTDYNDGFVLPSAIPQQTSVQMARSRDGRDHFYALDLQQRADAEPQGAPPTGFAAYLYGCLSLLREEGHPVSPVSILVDSEVPMGAGLSSSAALEVAVLRGARELFSLPVDDVRIAQLAQQAEIRFAHVNCGIMDQMASSLADPQHMLFLDTRTLQRKLLPLPQGGELLVIDSGVPRKLEESMYNLRRHECEEAARLLGVAALRDVEDVGRLSTLPDPLQRRARHVVTENARVLEAAAGVDACRFGKLMNASHQSLRDDYEVSIAALDLLVELLQRERFVYGARLTGAGFGGACVALVREGNGAAVGGEVLPRYQEKGYQGKLLVPR